MKTFEWCPQVNAGSVFYSLNSYGKMFEYKVVRRTKLNVWVTNGKWSEPAQYMLHSENWDGVTQGAPYIVIDNCKQRLLNKQG